MDSTGQALPLYNGPYDHMRNGFHSLESEFGKQHPVQLLQESLNSSAWLSKLDTVKRMYGSHLAMRLASERECFKHTKRLPGMASSKIGLQTLTGKDETMEFQDFLNDPMERPQIPRLEVHSHMEIKLGIM